MDEEYLIFAGNDIPAGGMDDFFGRVRSIEMAEEYIEDEEEEDFSWCHIAGSESLMVLKRGYKKVDASDLDNIEIWWEWHDEE